jgi:hypothetical protein
VVRWARLSPSLGRPYLQGTLELLIRVLTMRDVRHPMPLTQLLLLLHIQLNKLIMLVWLLLMGPLLGKLQPTTRWRSKCCWPHPSQMNRWKALLTPVTLSEPAACSPTLSGRRVLSPQIQLWGLQQEPLESHAQASGKLNRVLPHLSEYVRRPSDRSMGKLSSRQATSHCWESSWSQVTRLEFLPVTR